MVKTTNNNNIVYFIGFMLLFIIMTQNSDGVCSEPRDENERMGSSFMGLGGMALSGGMDLAAGRRWGGVGGYNPF